MKSLSCDVAAKVECAYNRCTPAVNAMELIVTRNKTEISETPNHLLNNYQNLSREENHVV